MTLKLTKKNARNIAEILSSRLKKNRPVGNLSKHFGKLKRDIDGLEYQLSLRENES
jgi:hypothetical protein